MSSQRNHYEVLGVPQTATTDQIKKKYRELARKYHPDVVKDKDFGQRLFSQINQAYRILNDTERRAQYDVTLLSATQKAAAQTNGTGAANGAAASSGAAHRNGAATGAMSANGTAAQSSMSSAQKTQAAAGLLGNADNAIMAGKPVEARAFCLKVLEMDPRNVRALEILGDALVSMGQREEAAAQYRKAIQITPSHSIQAKLTRTEQGGATARPAPAASRPAAPSFARPAAPAKEPARETVPAAANADKNGTDKAGADKAGGLLGRFLKRK